MRDNDPRPSFSIPPGPAFSDLARVIDTPMTIKDREGRVLFWFLPDIVSKNAQVNHKVL